MAVPEERADHLMADMGHSAWKRNIFQTHPTTANSPVQCSELRMSMRAKQCIISIQNRELEEDNNCVYSYLSSRLDNFNDSGRCR